MGDRFDVELEPEVRRWLDTLPIPAYRTVEYHADRLAASPTTLGEPYSKHLQGASAIFASTWEGLLGESPTGLLRNVGSCC